MKKVPQLTVVGLLILAACQGAYAQSTINMECTVTKVDPHFNTTVRYYENKDNEDYSTQRSFYKDGYKVEYNCFGKSFKYFTSKNLVVGDDMDVLFVVLPR